MRKNGSSFVADRGLELDIAAVEQILYYPCYIIPPLLVTCKQIPGTSYDVPGMGFD